MPYCVFNMALYQHVWHFDVFFIRSGYIIVSKLNLWSNRSIFIIRKMINLKISEINFEGIRNECFSGEGFSYF